MSKMDFRTLTPETLRELLALVQEKQELVIQVSKVDQQISSLMNGTPIKIVKPTKVQKPNGKKVAGKRGKLKDSILALLTEAGSKGIGVQDIAGKLGVNPTSVHAWFQTTARKDLRISKIGRGVYALTVPAEVSQIDSSVAPQ